MFPGPKLDVGGAVAGPGPCDQLGKTAVAVGADHEIHLRHALEQSGTEALRHAAHHSQHVSRPLVALELAEPAEHALLRVVPHGARIHEHHLGRVRIVGADVPLPSQHPEHQLGVGDVHLAAVGLDVDAWHAYAIVTGKRGRPSHGSLGT